MTTLEYMLTIDPAYGSQQHQRDYLERMELAQKLNPCTKDHSKDTPPTHVTACYPSDKQGRMVGS